MTSDVTNTIDKWLNSRARNLVNAYAKRACIDPEKARNVIMNRLIDMFEFKPGTEVKVKIYDAEEYEGTIIGRAKMPKCYRVERIVRRTGNRRVEAINQKFIRPMMAGK